MKQITALIRKNPILTFLVLMALSLLAIYYVTTLFEFAFNDLTSSFITEIILAALMLYIIYLINGPSELRFSMKGFGYAFKLAWWLIFLNLFAGVFNTFKNLGYVNTEYGNPVLVVIEIAAYMICIGIFEEGLYRGVGLSAFLEKDGGSFNGVLKACIYSSLLFGISHVIFNIFGFIADPGALNAVSVLQIILKTLQTGIFGFVYSVIYLKTHNLWDVAILHALGDFVTIMPNYLFVNNTSGRGYVQSGASGDLNVLAYVLIIAIMLPAGIYSYFQLKHVKLPQWGLFKVKWYPLDVRKNKIVGE